MAISLNSTGLFPDYSSQTNAIWNNFSANLAKQEQDSKLQQLKFKFEADKKEQEEAQKLQDEKKASSNNIEELEKKRKDVLNPNKPLDSLNESKKDATDNTEKPKLSFEEKLKNLGKGALRSITGMVMENGHFSWKRTLITVGIAAAAIAIDVLTAGAATPFLVGIGALFAGGQAASGLSKTANAKTQEEYEEAYKEIGEGTAGVGLSLLGGKSIKGIKLGKITKIAGEPGKIAEVAEAAEVAAKSGKIVRTPETLKSILSNAKLSGKSAEIAQVALEQVQSGNPKLVKSGLESLEMLSHRLDNKELLVKVTAAQKTLTPQLPKSSLRKWELPEEFKNLATLPEGIEEASSKKAALAKLTAAIKEETDPERKIALRLVMGKIEATPHPMLATVGEFTSTAKAGASEIIKPKNIFNKRNLAYTTVTVPENSAYNSLKKAEEMIQRQMQASQIDEELKEAYGEKIKNLVESAYKEGVGDQVDITIPDNPTAEDLKSFTADLETKIENAKATKIKTEQNNQEIDTLIQKAQELGIEIDPTSETVDSLKQKIEDAE